MKKIKLANIAESQLKAISDTAPVVSIYSRYDSPSNIPNEENRMVFRLKLDVMFEHDSEHGMTEEKTKDLLEFVKKAAETEEEVIYFQCREGRIRSYTLVEAFAILGLSDSDHKVFNAEFVPTHAVSINKGSIDRILLHDTINNAVKLEPTLD